MATVHIVLTQVKALSEDGNGVAVPASQEKLADTMTSTTTSVKAAIAADYTDAVDDFWTITVAGGNAWVKFGLDPTAASDTGYLLVDGQTRDFSVSQLGETVAVKTA